MSLRRSVVGYDFAFGGETPHEGDEGYQLALHENLKKFRLSGVHYTPNLDMDIDIKKIARMSRSNADFKRNLKIYLTL